MKPTVSDRSTRGRVAGTSGRTVVSSVANSAIGDAGPRCRSARASASTCRRWCSRPARRGSCRGGGRAGSAARRPSPPSSPGQLGDAIADLAAVELQARLPAPLPPMPPRCRSFPLPCSRRRGTMYWSRTISTCALAARERAWRRKISRMTAVRSQHLDAGRLLQIARLRRRDVVIDQHRLNRRRPGRPSDASSSAGGRSSSSLPLRRSRRRSPRGRRLFVVFVRLRPRQSARRCGRPGACSSASFPLPNSAAGCNVLRRWVTVATTFTPSVRPNRRSSAIDAAKA